MAERIDIEEIDPDLFKYALSLLINVGSHEV